MKRLCSINAHVLCCCCPFHVYKQCLACLKRYRRSSMQAFLGRSSCTLFYVYQMSKQLYSVFSLLPSAFFPSLFPSSFTPSLIPSSSYTLPFFYLHSSLLPSLLPSSPYTLPFFSVDSFLLPLLFSHMSKAIFLMSYPCVSV